jgi:HPt (histidine-containing phosphotransfer) domain-containing protein
MDESRTNRSIAAVDVEELLSLCEDDGEMLGELLRAFAEDEPRLYGALERALHVEDFEHLAKNAHALKGVLAALAAIPGRDLALALERAGRNANLEEARRIMPLLREELDRVARALDVLEGALPHDASA